MLWQIYECSTNLSFLRYNPFVHNTVSYFMFLDFICYHYRSLDFLSLFLHPPISSETLVQFSTWWKYLIICQFKSPQQSHPNNLNNCSPGLWFYKTSFWGCLSSLIYFYTLFSLPMLPFISYFYFMYLFLWRESFCIFGKNIIFEVLFMSWNNYILPSPMIATLVGIKFIFKTLPT